MTDAIKTIKLESQEGEIFDIDAAILNLSDVLKGFSENGSDCVIPVKNINSAVLKKVIEWATHHKDDPLSSEDDENREKDCNNMSAWDEEFLKVDQGTLFELVLAANYLNMSGLLDLTCKHIATMIKGKSPSEIYRIFNIKDDFTPAEEEQIRKENEWCEEK